MIKTKKIFLRLIFIITFSFLLSSFAEYLLLIIPPVQKKAIDKISEIINQYITGKITVESISTNLWTNVELHKIKIKSKEDSLDSIYIDKIKINYRLIKLLLFRNIEIPFAEVKNINVLFYISSDGKIKLPVLPQDKKNKINKNGAKLKLSVSRIKISKLQCLFIDSLLNQYALITDASVKGKIYSLDSIKTEIKIINSIYRSEWWNGVIERLEGSALITPNYIKIFYVDMNSNNGNLKGNGIIPLRKEFPWNIQVSTYAKVSSLPVLYKSVNFLDSSGIISLKGTLNGQLEKPSIKINLIGNEFLYSSLKLDSFEINANYDTKGNFYSNGMIVSEAGEAKFKIKGVINKIFVSPEVYSYCSKIELEKIQINKLKKAFPLIPQYLDSTILKSEIEVAGKSTKELPSMVIVKGNAINEKYLIYPFEFSFNFDKKNWELLISNGNNKISGIGTLDGKEKIKGDILISLVNLSILKIEELQKIKGNLFSSVNINGKLENPLILATINGKSIEWRGSHIDTIIAKLNINKQKRYIDTIYSRGIINIDSLASVYNRIVPITPNLKLSLSGKGELLSPYLKIKANTGKLSFKNFTFDSSELFFDFNKLDTINIKKFLVWKEEGNGINFYGKLKIKEPFCGDIKGDLFCNSKENIGDNFSLIGNFKRDSFELKINTSEINLQSVLSLLSKKEKVNGNVSLKANIEGNYKNPDGKIFIQGKEIKYDKFVFSEANIEGNLRDSSALLKIEISPYGSKNSLLIEGNASFLPSSKWKLNEDNDSSLFLKVRGKDIKLDSIINLLDSSIKMEATLSIDVGYNFTKRNQLLMGELKIDNCKIEDIKRKIRAHEINTSVFIYGTPFDPEINYKIISGNIELFSGEIDSVILNGYASTNGLSVNRIDIGLGREGKTVSSGYIPFKKLKYKIEPVLDSLSGSFSFEKLSLPLFNQFFESEIIREGKLNGFGSISRKNGKIDLNGEIELTNSVINLEDINPNIGPINGLLKMRNDSIIIENLSGIWGKGHLNSKGYINLQNIKEPKVDIELSGKNLNLNFDKQIIIGIDTVYLSYTNDKGKGYLISGNIEADKSTYSEDIQIVNLINELSKPQILHKKDDKNDLLNNTKLNISLNINENLEIKTNLGYLRIDGTLVIGGTLNKPSFTGEVLALEGYVWYLDRKFTIEQAKLTNFSSKDINPVIDLKATTEVVVITGDQAENYTIILTIQGDIKNPTIKLSESNNELNEFEIITVLTFGQLPGSISSDTKERLRTFLSQSIIGFGTRRLEKILNIDRIILEGDIFGGKESLESTKIKLTRRISPRLTLLYESEIGNLTKPKISALYRLTNNIFISGERTSEGKSGIDIILKYSK